MAMERHWLLHQDLISLRRMSQITLRWCLHRPLYNSSLVLLPWPRGQPPTSPEARCLQREPSKRECSFSPLQKSNLSKFSRPSHRPSQPSLPHSTLITNTPSWSSQGRVRKHSIPKTTRHAWIPLSKVFTPPMAIWSKSSSRRLSPSFTLSFRILMYDFY